MFGSIAGEGELVDAIQEIDSVVIEDYLDRSGQEDG